MASRAPASKTIGSILQTIFPGEVHTLSTSAVAQLTPVFSDQTTVLEITADYDTYIEIGTAPVATPGNGTTFKIRGQMVFSYGIRPGERISYLQKDSSGELQIIEGSD